MDIIGLPFHAVLGIPGEEVFVDVCKSGRFLSAEDCQGIVRSYQVKWNENFLRPLTPLDTVGRMGSIVFNCQSQANARGLMFPGFERTLLW